MKRLFLIIAYAILSLAIVYPVCADDIFPPYINWRKRGNNLYPVNSSDNVGIGTTAPAYKLQVVGTVASQNLRFGTNYDNIFPAETGANNQILKTNSAGVITWQNDADSGASGVQSVTASLPLTSSGGTAPQIALTIDNITIGTNASNQLIIKDGGVDLTTKISGTLPLVSTPIIPLATQVSGTLPLANTPTIPLTTKVSETLPLANTPIIPLETKVSGTLPDASLSVNVTKLGPSINLTTEVSETLPLANTPIIPLTTQVSETLPLVNTPVIPLTTKVSETLPLVNTPIIPLATKVSGTLPDECSPVNTINHSITSDSGAFTQLKIAGTPTSTQLTTNTLRTGDTIPLMRLNILNAAVGTIPGATLHVTKNYILDQLVAQIAGAGATNIQFILRQVSADGTTPLYTLATGTAAKAKLTITSFAGNSVPAGNLVVLDLTAVNGGATPPSMRLEVHGHEY